MTQTDGVTRLLVLRQIEKLRIMSFAFFIFVLLSSQRFSGWSAVTKFVFSSNFFYGNTRIKCYLQKGALTLNIRLSGNKGSPAENPAA